MTADQIRTEIPFILPPVVPTNAPTRCGHGIIVPVTADANTSVTVTHGLARKIQAAWCISNDAGAAFAPKLKFGTEVSTAQQVDLIGDVAMTNALVVLL